MLIDSSIDVLGVYYLILPLSSEIISFYLFFLVILMLISEVILSILLEYILFYFIKL